LVTSPIGGKRILLGQARPPSVERSAFSV